MTTHKTFGGYFLAHILSSTHSHPGTQLMELFALEL